MKTCFYFPLEDKNYLCTDIISYLCRIQFNLIFVVNNNKERFIELLGLENLYPHISSFNGMKILFSVFEIVEKYHGRFLHEKIKSTEIIFGVSL